MENASATEYVKFKTGSTGPIDVNFCCYGFA